MGSFGNVVAKILPDGVTDGLENFMAQLGTHQDKRNHSKFNNNKRLSLDGNREELDALYQTDWVAGKVVDVVPNDMTREWRSFTGDIDPTVIAALKAEEERLDLAGTINTAHKWSRLYGTGFVIISVADGLEADQPLEMDRIGPGSLQHITAIDRHRMERSDQVSEDPFDTNFGMPEFYTVRGSNIRIHQTRLLRLDGLILPFDKFRENNYWSDSILDRLYETITDFATTARASSSLVYESNVDITKVKGLMNYLQTAEGESILRKRFTLASMMKSINNMMLIDSEEEFITKTSSFAGLPELLRIFMELLSAATDIPATRLLGSSASGLSATGEGDQKNYYDMIRSQQNAVYRPKLNYFDQIMARSLSIPADADLTYTFNSLFQMTEGQVSDIELKNAQRDQIYLDQGIVSEDIIAKELKQDGTYSNITDEYITELEADITEGFTNA